VQQRSAQCNYTRTTAYEEVKTMTILAQSIIVADWHYRIDPDVAATVASRIKAIIAWRTAACTLKMRATSGEL